MKSQSYVMLLREGDDEWLARIGLELDGQMQPFHMTGSDLSTLIDRIGTFTQTMAQSPDLTCRPEDLLNINAEAAHTSILLKCKRLSVGWGIVLYRTEVDSERGSLWFALIGYRDQLMERGEHATAGASVDLADALANINVVRTCTSVHWNRDMKHSLLDRKSDGTHVTAATRKRERQSHHNHLQEARNEEWRNSPRSKEWAELLKSKTRRDSS